MFKTLSGLTDIAFLCVSADTKTCGSPLYLRPARGGQATGGSLRQAQDRLRLPAGKHTGILTQIQTKVKKKMSRNRKFLTVQGNFCRIIDVAGENYAV